MDNHLYAALAALGTKMTPPMVQASCALAKERLAPDLASGVECVRDLSYGPHERHKIDLFKASGGESKPVLLFVHGGGFVGGDRVMAPGLPFYDNIGQWAAKQGYVGATMTYRLAPEFAYPTGAEDVAAAVAWLKANAAAHGGDPARIFIMGQSAGAVHIADYLAHPATAEIATRDLAGAVLLSCLYDVGVAEQNRMQKAYFGDDPATWADKSALMGLLTTKTPLLCAVAEFDIPDFQAQAARFAAAWLEARESYPPLLRLTGHNHLSTILQLGAPDDTLGAELRLFIQRLSAS